MLVLSREKAPALEGEQDSGLQAAAVASLRSSPYRPLWHLHCKVREGVVVVSGVVPSFYLKQMAQTVLQALDRINGVENLLVVAEPQARWSLVAVAG